MQDLVQMMTQTLRMNIEDSVNEADKGIFGLTGLPEFKLNRKYRDTLALHGKSREEAENLSLGQIPLGQILLTIFFDKPCQYELLILIRTSVIKAPHLDQPRYGEPLNT